MKELGTSSGGQATRAVVAGGGGRCIRDVQAVGSRSSSLGQAVGLASMVAVGTGDRR
ncbi:hypothetical protein ACLOJK_018734 [Asimina triloba]